MEVKEEQLQKYLDEHDKHEFTAKQLFEWCDEDKDALLKIDEA